MSDHEPNTFLPEPPPPKSNLDGVLTADDDRLVPAIIYGLYILPFGGVTHVVGLIMAYVVKDNAPEWLRSHYSYLIRTFWMGLLYAAISFCLMIVGIGFILFGVLWVWFVVRCAMGVVRLLTANPSPIRHADLKPGGPARLQAKAGWRRTMLA